MLSKTSLIAAITATEFSYAENGADWADLDIADNECGGLSQSPINFVFAKNNEFKKEYKNKIWGWKDDDPKETMTMGST